MGILLITREITLVVCICEGKCVITATEKIILQQGLEPVCQFDFRIFDRLLYRMYIFL